MNLTGDGKSLIRIEAPVAHCTLMNGIYIGNVPAITYAINKAETRNVQEINLIKVAVD